MCRYGYGKVSNVQTSEVMKRLDLSCLPLNLEVGETMELIDKDGKYHLLQCVKSKDRGLCEGCFFSNLSILSTCSNVMCVSRERGEERGDVIYIELPVKNEFEEEESEMKTLTFDDLLETKTIKEGEKFIYVDCLDVQHKIIAKRVGTLSSSVACGRCVFNNDACCLVCCLQSDRESRDDVYFEELT